GVAREEARLLQRRTVVLPVDLVERARDRQTQGPRLARGAAAGDAGDHVVRADEVEHLERVGDELLVQLVREVVLEGAAVHGERPRTGDETHARDGLLATADGRAGDVDDARSPGRLRRGRRRLGAER